MFLARTADDCVRMFFGRCAKQRVPGDGSCSGATSSAEIRGAMFRPPPGLVVVMGAPAQPAAFAPLHPFNGRYAFDQALDFPCFPTSKCDRNLCTNSDSELQNAPFGEIGAENGSGYPARLGHHRPPICLGFLRLLAAHHPPGVVPSETVRRLLRYAMPAPFSCGYPHALFSPNSSNNAPACLMPKSVSARYDHLVMPYSTEQGIHEFLSQVCFSCTICTSPHICAQRPIPPLP